MEASKRPPFAPSIWCKQGHGLVHHMRKDRLVERKPKEFVFQEWDDLS